MSVPNPPPLPTQSPPLPVRVEVDDQHPWLGLASFTEETRGYFYGREDEVAELARRVQRKLLTILFGQSGLGKTSILRALAAMGYPVVAEAATDVIAAARNQ